MRLLLSSLLLSFCCSAVAAQNEPASHWLERLSSALRTLNFTTSFVVVKNNQAEPYHWVHGVNDAGLELEIFSLLNGPRRDILRQGEIVSYISPEQPPYSIKSQHLSSPIPSLLRHNLDILLPNYNFISVGRSRVLGRPAQLIRIESKDEHRYGHWLWLDQTTGLLLKLALVSKQGELLEQVQFTHLDITTTLSDSLKKLETTELPAQIDLPQGIDEKEISWKVSWLPRGFKQIKASKHRVPIIKNSVGFMLFNDGLVDVSVYVNSTQTKQRKVEHVNDGATLVLNQVKNGVEISVVGQIPFETAQAIANSVVLTASPSS